MAINRRELLVRGGTAAALGAGGLASAASAQAQQPPIQWQREADVVVIGSGACGLPAAIVAQEAGSSVIVVEAQPHIGGHARVQRRQHAARRRHQRAEEVRHRGLARPGVPGPDRLVGGAAQRLSGLSLQRPRDHPRLRRQLRRHLRVPARARRRLRRQAAGPAGRRLGRQLGAARPCMPRRWTGR